MRLASAGLQDMKRFLLHFDWILRHKIATIVLAIAAAAVLVVCVMRVIDDSQGAICHRGRCADRPRACLSPISLPKAIAVAATRSRS